MDQLVEADGVHLRILFWPWPRIRGLAETNGAWPDGERFTLEAQSVWLDDAKRTLGSEQALTIRSPSRLADAAGFVGRFDGTQLQLRDVEMRYDPEG